EARSSLSVLSNRPSGAFRSLRCLIYKVHAALSAKVHYSRSAFICQPLFLAFFRRSVVHPTVLPDSFVRLPNLLPFVNTFFQSFFGFLSKNLLHGLSLDSIFHNIPCAARVSAVFS
ncbi:MAG: hypothetical protein KHW76_09820, partial [Oscillibacter sp.]|nr:hypothetical protein [Oscillibacter sp.]